jgi:ADP-ribose pyrophosphatase YjhB (NUDIX family)
MTQLRDWTGAPIDAPTQIQVGTSAFVLNSEGKLLLQQRDDNRHWAMPGGRLDPGETISDCAVREVFEETGLRVKIKRLIGVYSDPQQYMLAQNRHGKIVQMVNCCFECEIIGGEMKLSDESIDIGFFDTQNLPQPMLLNHLVRIEDAQKRDTGSFVR